MCTPLGFGLWTIILAVPALTRTQTIRITTGLRHMAVGAFWFSVMSVLVKLAGQRLPSMEIVFFRGILTLAMSYVIVKRAGIQPVLGTNRRLLLQRGILGAAALACFLFSLTHLPLAEATLIQAPAFVELRDGERTYVVAHAPGWSGCLLFLLCLVLQIRLRPPAGTKFL